MISAIVVNVYRMVLLYSVILNIFGTLPIFFRG